MYICVICIYAYINNKLCIYIYIYIYFYWPPSQEGMPNLPTKLTPAKTV